MRTIRTILVPTDFSASSSAAFQMAEALSSAVGAHVHLLHVVPTRFVYDAWGTESGALRMADLIESLQQKARRNFDRLVARSAVPKNRLTRATVNGHVVAEILAYVRKRRVDLVVMGTHGRSRLERALVGSVTDRISRLSPVPVLIVPPPAGVRPRRPAGRRR